MITQEAEDRNLRDKIMRQDLYVKVQSLAEGVCLPYLPLLFQPLMFSRLSSQTPQQQPQRIPLRSAMLFIVKGCSGTVTSILPDILVDITIFLNKDISASNGFGLIFLSRSNNVRLIFAAVAYRFQDSCLTGELQVLPLLSSQLASHVGLFLD